MSDATAGTYTFLFTDIEGCVRLGVEFPAAMPGAQKRHDEILRSSMVRNRVDPSGIKKRLNITVDRGTAKSMNKLCREKRIPRDRFVSMYVDFLVKGDPEGSCISPLVKAAQLIRDPRHEYMSSAGNNPYDDLHIPESTVQALDELLGDLVRRTD